MDPGDGLGIDQPRRPYGKAQWDQRETALIPVTPFNSAPPAFA